MQEKIKPFDLKSIHMLSTLKARISMLWSAALKTEGLGRLGFDSSNYAKFSSQDELDSLLHYQKIVSFYKSTMFDLENRERVLVDWIKHNYDDKSIRMQIIPRQSFIPRIIKNTSMLYKTGAERRLMTEGGELAKEDEAYQKINKGAQIGRQSKQWYRLYRLCDVVSVMPVYREVQGRKKLFYDTITPNDFRVMLDASGDMIKFMYQSELVIRDAVTENIIVVWSDEEHYYLTHNGEKKFFEGNPEGVNPYGTIPAVLMAKDRQDIYAGGMWSLVESNLLVNYYKMLEAEDSTFAAINIPVGKNIVDQSDKDRYSFSPRKPIIVNTRDQGDVADFSLVSGTPHGKSIRELAETEEKIASMREGISPALLSSDVKELSGRAMRSLMTESIEQRSDDAEVMQEYEEELYEKVRIVSSVEKIATLPEGGFVIDFGELDFSDDPAAEYEFAKQRTEDGLLSPLDFLRAYGSTDAETDEEAAQQILKNRALLAKHKERYTFTGSRNAAVTG